MLCHFVTKFGVLFARVLIGLKDVSNDVHCVMRDDGMLVWVCFGHVWERVENTFKTFLLDTGRGARLL